MAHEVPFLGHGGFKRITTTQKINTLSEIHVITKFRTLTADVPKNVKHDFKRRKYIAIVYEELHEGCVDLCSLYNRRNTVNEGKKSYPTEKVTEVAALL